MNVLLLFSDKTFGEKVLNRLVDDYLEFGSVGVYTGSIAPSILSEQLFINVAGDVTIYVDGHSGRDIDFDDVIQVVPSGVAATLPDWVKSAGSVSVIEATAADRNPVSQHKINARAKAISDGFDWEIGGNSVRFQCDDEAKVNIVGQAMDLLIASFFGEQLPEVQWRAEDNQLYQFTGAEFLQFARASGAFVRRQYQKSW